MACGNLRRRLRVGIAHTGHLNPAFGRHLGIISRVMTSQTSDAYYSGAYFRFLAHI
jgi:hypothetical protein